MFPISLKSLSDKERHDYILQNYILNKNQNVEIRKHKRDIDVIKEHHRFLWDADKPSSDSWEERLARRYYDKLFKEYCIADLTRYKENRIAMRWRTEAEVVSGIGQFQCGSRKCEYKEALRSWEVNFAYIEQGEKKNALVKLRLCPQHSEFLNYTSKKREVKRLKRNNKKEHKYCKRLSTKVNSDKDNQIELPEVSDTNEDKTTYSEKSSEELELTSSDRHDNDDNVWNKKLDVELETQSRETEFEQYLENLLL